MIRRLILPLLLALPLAAFAQPLQNADFEGAASADGSPAAWGRYVSNGTARTALDDTVKHAGKASVRVEIDDASRCTVTQKIPAPEPGLYGFSVWVKTALPPTGAASLYIQWHDANRQTVSNSSPSKSLRGQSDWTQLYAMGDRPEGAVAALCVIVVDAAGGKGGTVWADDASFKLGVPEELLKPVPSDTADPMQMPIRPDNGRTILQNPPDFSWSPQEFAAQYEFQLSTDPKFPAAKTFTTRTPYNVYSHSAQLPLGKWHWRVRFTTGKDRWSEWLPSHNFVVTTAAKPFVVPPPDEMLGRIPQGHPRIYATAATLADFRAPMLGKKKEWWASFQQRLERYVAKPVDKAPSDEWRMGDRPGGGPLDDAAIEAGNKLRSYASQVNDRLQTLAFGYLLSGERKYADAAIAQMMEMATWDPKGITSYRNHDQVFRDIAWMTATAYDWCWDVMTPEQRKAIGDSILARARTLYADFQGRSRPIYAFPYDSHAITAYGYLGICAIALAREYPEADTWFRFVAATYPAVFPPWGGEEGGWSQGVGYWKWSQSFAWYFFDALRSATGVDLYQKAYNRNTGWFKLYMHPPWCDRHHFGDGNHGSPDNSDQANMARMANEYDNPYYQWYSANMRGTPSMGIYDYWWFDDTKQSRPPADLPQGKLFPDIGWVAMHSDLSDPNDVMLMFKSSQFGSFNHSHADQNSFVVYGYGEPLLIDSGYYDWYGSPHHQEFTIQTRSHNTVLVNGEGQAARDITSRGKIVDYFGSPAVDYTVGDATEAYKGKLTNFTRRILYLRPDSFLIVDELEAPEPSTFTWAMHAENEMKLDPSKQEVTVTRGGARCLVKFLTPQTLKFEQTDQFNPTTSRNSPNEWHTSVSTTEKTKRCRFVTFVRPCPASEPADALEIKSRLQDDLLLLVWGTEPKPGGVVAAWLGNEPNFTVVAPWGQGAVASVIDAKQVSVDDKQGKFQILSSDVPLKATMELSGNNNATAEVRRMTYQTTGPAKVTLRVRQAVKSLSLDGKPLPKTSFKWAKEKLTLQLPVGEHVLEVNPAAIKPAAPKTTLLLEGQPVQTDLRSMREYTGGQLSWGSFPAASVPATVEAVKAPAGTSVTIGTQAVAPGQMLWLRPSNELMIRSDDATKPVTINLRRLVTNAEPLLAQAVADDVEKKPGAIKLEAETFINSTDGVPSRYTNRPFLSGGVGMGNWSAPGMSVQWSLNAPQTGKYALLLKTATHEALADRLLTIDGKTLGSEPRVIRVANTGGFGSTPQEWRLVQLPQTLDLTAGPHTLQMTCLTGMLNLDYLVLVPQL
jgi:hypothetical protein